MSSSGPQGPPTGRWSWIPAHQPPRPPRHGGTAPHGDVPELTDHVVRVRWQGATIAEAEQVWVEGMRLIDQRAAQFPDNGHVINDFHGVIGGGWRAYAGRPVGPTGDAIALAFHASGGMIAQGMLSGIRIHPAHLGQSALFNFKILYP